jgi:hypothetical protein
VTRNTKKNKEHKKALSAWLLLPSLRPTNRCSDHCFHLQKRERKMISENVLKVRNIKKKAN